MRVTKLRKRYTHLSDNQHSKGHTLTEGIENPESANDGNLSKTKIECKLQQQKGSPKTY